MVPKGWSQGRKKEWDALGLELEEGRAKPWDGPSTPGAPKDTPQPRLTARFRVQVVTEVKARVSSGMCLKHACHKTPRGI